MVMCSWGFGGYCWTYANICVGGFIDSWTQHFKKIKVTQCVFRRVLRVIYDSSKTYVCSHADEMFYRGFCFLLKFLQEGDIDWQELSIDDVCNQFRDHCAVVRHKACIF